MPLSNALPGSRQADRQTDRETSREADRETDSQTERRRDVDNVCSAWLLRREALTSDGGEDKEGDDSIVQPTG